MIVFKPFKPKLSLILIEVAPKLPLIGVDLDALSALSLFLFVIVFFPTSLFLLT